MKRSLGLALLALSTPAFADDALTIPSVALDPPEKPSPWSGLYVGSGVSFAAARGQKGGAGADVFAGYDKTFADNFVLGLKFDTGFAPFLSPSGRFRGYDFAMGEAKLGYDFGRVTPFVYAGGGFARATTYANALPDAAGSMNGLFGPGPSQGVATFGAGVDYHVTNNLTVSVSGGVVNGPNGGF